MKNQILGWMMAVFSFSALSAPNGGPPARSENWLDRAWEIRYVLFAEDASLMRSGVAYSKKFNVQQAKRGKQKIYLNADALFDITATFTVPKAEAIAIILLKFDTRGRVINQRRELGNMSAKRSRLGDLVFIRNDASDPDPYHFAEWAQGIPGDVTFSPAVCSAEDHRRYVAATSPVGTWTTTLVISAAANGRLSCMTATSRIST